MRRCLLLILLLGAAALPALPAVAQSAPPQIIWSGEDYVFFARPKAPAAPPPAPERIEHVIQRFPSGQVQFDGYQLGKVKVGVWKEFDRSGNLLSETPYVRGVQHGEVIRYHTTCPNKSDPPAPPPAPTTTSTSRTGRTAEYACSGGKSVEGTTSRRPATRHLALVPRGQGRPGRRQADVLRVQEVRRRPRAGRKRRGSRRGDSRVPEEVLHAGARAVDGRRPQHLRLRRAGPRRMEEPPPLSRCKRPTRLWAFAPAEPPVSRRACASFDDVDHPEPRQAGRSDPGPRGGGKAPPRARGAEARTRRRSPALRLPRLRTGRRRQGVLPRMPGRHDGTGSLAPPI